MIWWYSQTGVPNKVGVVVVEGGVPIELFAVAHGLTGEEELLVFSVDNDAAIMKLDTDRQPTRIQHRSCPCPCRAAFISCFGSETVANIQTVRSYRALFPKEMDCSKYFVIFRSGAEMLLYWSDS